MKLAILIICQNVLNLITQILYCVIIFPVVFFVYEQLQEIPFGQKWMLEKDARNSRPPLRAMMPKPNVTRSIKFKSFESYLGIFIFYIIGVLFEIKLIATLYL